MKRTLSLLLTLATLTIPAHAEEESAMQLFAINVGKADALLVSSGPHTYLIDSGTKESWGALSRALTTLEVDHLTGVILTHTHDDHAGGLSTLATSPIQVDGWYAPLWYTGVKEKKHPATVAAALRGEIVNWLEAGDALPLGDGTLTVLGPRSLSETENCNSLVLLAEAAGGRMLLTGDMEFPEENELLSAGVIPPGDVLKIGNHGNKDATSQALVRQVQPQVAIVTTDSKVEPDTPAVRVMDALRGVDATVYQTQHATAGVLVTIRAGEVTANLMDYGAHPAIPQGVRLTDQDKENDSIRIRNDGAQPVDISGWYIVSERGGEQLVLPAGTILAPGGEVTVTTESSDEPGDVHWPDKKVWHKSKDDRAMLYDPYGRLVDELE